uniref:Two-component sensor histidine kinase n=1 Tax=Syphacia muris TaxID=451379 RepID=A0A0N5AJX5_9BILA
MATYWRRLSIFFSLVLFTAAVALVIVALLTEYWLESRPLDAKNAVNRYNYIHSGLFKGSRQLDWGLGPRYKALSFSFYLMIATMVLLLIPNVLMFVTEKSIRNPKNDKHLSVDNTAFLY